MSASKTIPAWTAHNLVSHRRKHRACFEDLLKIIGREITDPEYERRVQQAIDQSWLEYEGCHRDGDRYTGIRATYVDNDLITAVADQGRAHMITGFHEHFDRPHSIAMGRHASVGERKLACRKHLRWDEQGGIVVKMRVIRDD